MVTIEYKEEAETIYKYSHGIGVQVPTIHTAITFFKEGAMVTARIVGIEQVIDVSSNDVFINISVTTSISNSSKC